MTRIETRQASSWTKPWTDSNKFVNLKLTRIHHPIPFFMSAKCINYQQLPKKKQPPTYRTTEHWPWNHSPKKTRVHPCFFLTTRWVSLGHVSVNSFASTGHWSAPHREKRRGFTYGNLWKWNSPKGNLRNLTKKHLQMVEVLRTLRLLVVFWDFLFNLPGKAPTLNSKSLVVISWWLCG